MPPNEVGPRAGHHSRAEDTDTTTSNHHKAGNPNCTQPCPWPQQAHADLGIVDDDGAVGT